MCLACIVYNIMNKNVWLIFMMDSFVNNCIAGKVYWSWLVIILCYEVKDYKWLHV